MADLLAFLHAEISGCASDFQAREAEHMQLMSEAELNWSRFGRALSNFSG